MARFVLITKGSYGDLVPFLAIGCALRSRGHSVAIATHCTYSEPIRRSGLEFAALDTPAEYEAFIRDGALLDTPRRLRDFADRHIFSQAQREGRCLLDCCTQDVVMLVRHMSSVTAWCVAERLKIPIGVVFTAVAQANCISMLATIGDTYLLNGLNDIRSGLSLATVSTCERWLRGADFYVNCWPSWFASPTEAWPRDTISVGFLQHDPSESGPLPVSADEMLRDTDTILITGGTAVWALSRRFYYAVVEACAANDRRAVLACRFPDLLPSPLPPNVRAYSRLPFADVVPRVAAIVHHAGTSVLVRGLRAGKPQLLLPFGADRPDTAARLARLGVAKVLPPPSWQPENVGVAIDALLRSPEVGAACARWRERLEVEDELSAGCVQIERLANRCAARTTPLA
jgi:UDP:flavonoid glycosyltransferase YjiC (YdhE family)